MKRGIEITQVYIQSHTDTTRTAVKITKKRGKLTLDEIEDLLRYENGQSWCGHYIILLNCSEATLEGSSWFVEEEPKGDVVYLHKIEGDDSCPVCGQLTPPFDYCPSCGTTWKDNSLGIEKMIQLMREKSVRMVRESKERDRKLAWYWSYVGALDLAQQLNFRTEERKQELAPESSTWKPA